jgi:ATP-dependent helicase HrpB
MKPILRARLDWEQRRRLDRLAPAHFTVPSGSRIRLDYTAGDAPVLAVRLQELFGLQATPTIMDGQCPVLVHLLSPAGRPVQITRDLAGFWKGAYGEVKKEMKGRYPKHYWPDNPLKAVATRKVKPKKKKN